MACKIVTLDGDGWDDGSAALAEGFAHEVAARGHPWIVQPDTLNFGKKMPPLGIEPKTLGYL